MYLTIFNPLLTLNASVHIFILSNRLLFFFIFIIAKLCLFLCSLYKLHSWKLNQHLKVRAEELPGVTVIKVREEGREVKRDGRDRERETERNREKE